MAIIATERLLILLLENELAKQGKDPEQWSFMPHYFGYEGRCAMPSNFDANYCYSLGFVAGTMYFDKEKRSLPLNAPYTRVLRRVTTPFALHDNAVL